MARNIISIILMLLLLLPIVVAEGVVGGATIPASGGAPGGGGSYVSPTMELIVEEIPVEIQFVPFGATLGWEWIDRVQDLVTLVGVPVAIYLLWDIWVRMKRLELKLEIEPIKRRVI